MYAHKYLRSVTFNGHPATAELIIRLFSIHNSSLWKINAFFSKTQANKTLTLTTTIPNSPSHCYTFCDY